MGVWSIGHPCIGREARWRTINYSQLIKFKKYIVIIKGVINQCVMELMNLYRPHIERRAQTQKQLVLHR